MIDNSGSLSAANTAQSLAAAKAGRSWFYFENVDSSAVMWIEFDGTTAVESQPSIRVGPYGWVSWSKGHENGYVPETAFSVIGDTQDAQYVCKEN